MKNLNRPQKNLFFYEIKKPVGMNKLNNLKRKSRAEVDSILKEWQYKARKKPIDANKKYCYSQAELKLNDFKQKKQTVIKK